MNWFTKLFDRNNDGHATDDVQRAASNANDYAKTHNTSLRTALILVVCSMALGAYLALHFFGK